MAGAGYKDFVDGDILTATQVDTYLMQQAVMVFDDASARTTALSGVIAEGMITYLKDVNAVEKYDGTSWSAIGVGDIEGVVAGIGLTGGGSSGTVTLDLDTASVYVVPSQSGQSGKFLTTNGTSSSWATVDALPSQSGNAGKYLTTDGTSASWAVVAAGGDPTPTVFLLMGA
jgi:hypothetical protein